MNDLVEHCLLIAHTNHDNSITETTCSASSAGLNMKVPYAWTCMIARPLQQSSFNMAWTRGTSGVCTPTAGSPKRAGKAELAGSSWQLANCNHSTSAVCALRLHGSALEQPLAVSDGFKSSRDLEAGMNPLMADGIRADGPDKVLGRGRGRGRD